MAAQITGVFSPQLQEKIVNSKILVVGAGGIGCEILKNLVLSGFKEIEIIDLDTIDVSNLNRQFLFHKDHVGKSKAEVAKASALTFNPNVNIKAYHDSITTVTYGVNFFQQFNIVLNALDNRQARNHVNRMCLSADVPLIESGTAGYNGQVELIKKGLTQCYECTPKAAQKSYAGCTIRNTPSEPIHCIVWAKHLFNQLFGETNDDEDVSPDSADPEAGGDDVTIEDLSKNTNETGNVDRVNTRQWAQNNNYNAEKVFNKLFHDDIKYLLRMANLWKNRKPPQPIKWNEFFTFDLSGGASISGSRNPTILPDQQIWSLAECAKVFSDSMNVLKSKLKKLPAGDHLVWDKDDKYAMDFVAACANIRGQVFNITQKSRFDVKSMAGNIIPAIATTNAITAGVVVMHAFKILENAYDKCKSVYMRLRPNARNQLFVPDKFLSPPNTKCYVCSEKPTVYLKVDTNKLLVRELKDDVLIKVLNMVEPDVMLDSKGVIIISSEEGETDCNNEKKLSELDICDGAILKVDDFFQQYELSVIITHFDAKYDQALFEVVADIELLKSQQKDKSSSELDFNEEDTKESNGESTENEDSADDDEDCEIVEEKKQHLAEDFDDMDGAGGSGLCRPEMEEAGIDLDSSSDDDVVEIHANTSMKRKTDTEIEVEDLSNVKRVKIDSISEEDVIVLD